MGGERCLKYRAKLLPKDNFLKKNKKRRKISMKRFSLIMLCLLLAAFLFVSCEAESEEFVEPKAVDAASFENLFNDASANYVKLSNDISLSGKSVSFSSGNKIIDLGGNTLTLDSGTFDVVIADGSSFAIVNGTVKLPTAETSTIKPIDLNKGGKLYLENVTFDTDDTTLSCFFDCSDSQSELYLKNSVKENNAYKTSFRLFKNVLNHSTFDFNFDLYNFGNGKYEKKTSAVNNYLLDVSWS